ncbi:MAG TPA: ABC transporter permease subunit [Bacteroidales bacterium]|nr:ABC transporter permease subunit [Bacteroidales bacterium]HNS45966.1 ABC transporter permease subunit [Bacteroidales bacterium]
MRKTIWILTIQELKQSMRSKWFWIYSLLFGGFVAVMFALGITESQIIGFVGLSRLIVTFMQVCIVILPIYVLITTARSVVGDRETHVMEYILSLPMSFSSYFWAKLISRFIEVFTPVFIALLGATLWGLIIKIDVPWDLFALYSGLLAVMVFSFLGIAMYVSTFSSTQNMAVTTAFILWLVLVAFLDLILMGVLLKMKVEPAVVIGLGMLNPLQVFRTAALALFDPQLTVMGPASYYILDTVSRYGFILFALLYPLALGLIFAFLGNRYFKRKDLV